MAKKAYCSLTLLVSLFVLMACQIKPVRNEMEEELVEIQIDTMVLLEPPQPEDTLTAFEHVMERGALVAVTNCEDFNYKMYHAHPSGFAHDLLKDFCNMYHLRLEMMVNDDLDSCFAMLDSGEVDVVATPA